MEKRRYTIEANVATLARFTAECAAAGTPTDSFVHKVTCDVNEEYHYVFLSATKDVHERLHSRRFTSSIPTR